MRKHFTTLLLSLLLLGHTATQTPTPVPPPKAPTKTSAPMQKVVATWYNLVGRRAANGERIKEGDLITAHRTLPFGTMVRLVNPANGKEVVVKVIDRGPWLITEAGKYLPHPTRSFDLSLRAAEILGFKSKGVQALHMAILTSPLDESTSVR